MLILVLEIIRAVLLTILFFFLLRIGKRVELQKQSGWNYLLAGFGLLALGSVIDVSDQFPELSFLIIFGHTTAQAILEKVVGYSLGGILLFVGFWKWIPVVSRVFIIEKKIKHTNLYLEKQIEERTYQLKEANKSKAEFISVISHEIRTPLNAIIGTSHQLGTSLQSANTKKQVDKILKESHDLLKMFDEILDYSKIDGGKIRSDIHEVNFENFLHLFFDRFKTSAEDKNIHFEITSEGKINRRLKSNSLILEKVLVNILENAFKFTSSGFIKVKVQDIIEDEKIFMEIAVSDTGIGISKDKLDKITTMFYQVEDSSTRKFGGLGLGLAICVKYLDIIDGDLKIESQINEGSRFIIKIPIEVDIYDKIEINLHSKESELVQFSENNSSTLDIEKTEFEIIQKLLDELSSHLEDYDADSIKIADEIENILPGEETIKKIKKEIMNYQFDLAIEELKLLQSRITLKHSGLGGN
ncbi:MAG: hypothetical protein K9J12_01560 [Melioribacteraceae bacterium]|nr:hypothetical protein [Melioribacteraceae bacterium]